MLVNVQLPVFVFTIPVFVGVAHAESVHTQISYHDTLELHHTSDELVFHRNLGILDVTQPLLVGVVNVGALGPAASYSREIVLLAPVFAFHTRSVNAQVSTTTETVPVNGIFNGTSLKQRTE